MRKITLNPTEENELERVDKFISDNSDISRSYAARLCEMGLVTCEGKPIGKKSRVKKDCAIEIELPQTEEMSAEPENIPLDVVYEDDDVIVVNKPQGMVVHPAAGNASGTLVNALMYHCRGGLSAINGVIRPGIVHRIDKDTSGLIVAAKNNEAHLALSAQLKERKALRKYIALVNGIIKDDEGTVNKPIARSAADRKKMAVRADGRDAVTHYRVIERFPNRNGASYTLVECVLETGRTHQIRVHMASIGHSIVGDKKYGIKKEKFNLNGQLLHARTIGFTHPSTGVAMEFTSELPSYFSEIIEWLGGNINF